MTPAARISAAIEILDLHLAGHPAEKALTGWARRARFAGSKDRAAIRDHVFDALRCKRSYGALGGAITGRGLMLGALRAARVPPETMFTGQGHAPAPLSPAEAAPPRPLQALEALDCPDWLAPALRDSLGADFAPVCEALRRRAPVFLRVNLRKVSRDEAMQALAAESIVAQPHPLSKSALQVTENARKIQHSKAYLDGLVELQDAASQAVVDFLPCAGPARVLDYCAGGGGKALALAARGACDVFAHDADPRRMKDLPARAARAGVEITQVPTDRIIAQGAFDLVLCDVPCSGSGAWRRSPEGKWALTPERLQDLQQIQADILDKTVPYLAEHGVLAYTTCALLRSENEDQVTAFLDRHAGWRCTGSRRLTPLDGGDGFFAALLSRA